MRFMLAAESIVSFNGRRLVGKRTYLFVPQ